MSCNSMIYHCHCTHHQDVNLLLCQKRDHTSSCNKSNNYLKQVCILIGDPTALKMIFGLSHAHIHCSLCAHRSTYSDCILQVFGQTRFEPRQEYRLCCHSGCEKHWLWKHVQMPWKSVIYFWGSLELTIWIGHLLEYCSSIIILWSRFSAGKIMLI